MGKIDRLTYYINRAVPYAWDDSESWVEFLGKVVQKVNELVDLSNDYFKIDLADYVTNILTEWRDNGELETIVNNAFDAKFDTFNNAFINMSNEIDGFQAVVDGFTDTVTDYEKIGVLVKPSMTQAQIQEALNNHKNVVFEQGTYNVDAIVGLNLVSDQTVNLNGSIIKAIPNTAEDYAIFNINARQNVTLKNGRIVGDRNEHNGTTGEWGMGVSVRGSENVTLENLYVEGCWGDGIYLGTTEANNHIENNNVNIRRCTMNNNRRNGMSVISAKGLYLENNTIKNTNGTEPEAGIDFEPNFSYNIIDNIFIDGLLTENNNGSGVIFSLLSLNDGERNITIRVNNHIDNGSRRGFHMFRHFNINSKIDAILSNSRYTSTLHQAVFVQDFRGSDDSKFLVDNVKIENANIENVQETKTYYDAPVFLLSTATNLSNGVINTHLRNVNIKQDNLPYAMLSTRNFKAVDITELTVENLTHNLNNRQYTEYYVQGLKRQTIIENVYKREMTNQLSRNISRAAFSPHYSNDGATQAFSLIVENNLNDGTEFLITVKEDFNIYLKTTNITLVGIEVGANGVTSKTPGAMIRIKKVGDVFQVTQMVGDWAAY